MTLSPARIRAFHKTIYDYYEKNGRHDLPWRRGKITPYTTFVSEVMLQQTQVPRVVEKYREWLRAFPNFKKLAAAEFQTVLAVWQGMGYNRRAKFLHESAKIILKEYSGRLPRDPALLEKLPGIGKNTAASIAAFGFDVPTVFIETNIRSVFIHHFFPDRSDVADAEILPLLAATLDHSAPHRFYSAIMDYGTFLKSQLPNPSKRSRHHAPQPKFEGSNRQVRGAVLRALATGEKKTAAELATLTQFPPARVLAAAEALHREGMIRLARGTFFV